MTASSFSQDVVADGALAFWPLNDANTSNGATTVSLVNPSTYNGTFQSGNQVGDGVTSGPAAYAALGSASYFHNTTANTSLAASDAVITPNIGLPTGTADRTVLFWAKDNNTSADSHYHAATEYGSPGTFTSGLGTFVFASGDSNSPTGGMGVSPWGGGTGTTTAFTDGQWHFFAVTLSGGTSTPTYSVYADGVLQNSAAISTNTILGLANAIGSSASVDGSNIVSWNGGLSDVAVFGSALSSTQIAQLYSDASNGAVLSITSGHSGEFRQGDTEAAGDFYTLSVTNSGNVPTSGTVTLVDTLPSGLSVISASGDGWAASISGQTITATRTDALAAGATYPVLTIAVSVAGAAPASVINAGTVSGGGLIASSHTFSDSTTISHLPSTFSNDVIADGALAFWPLNESNTQNGATAASLVNPSAYSGIYQSGNQTGDGVTSGPAAFPALGSAAYFHNTSTNTSLAASDAVITPNIGLPTGTADRTVLFWAKDNNTSADSSYHAATEYGSPGTLTSGLGTFVFASGDSNSPTGGMGVSPWGGGTGTTTAFTDGQWHFFAVTISGGASAPTYSVYADGVLQNSTAISTSTILGLANTIGSSASVDGSGIVGWNGGLGDVAIIGSALSPAQIAQLYADAPNGAALSVTSTHSGHFQQGDTASANDSYVLSVANTGNVATAGPVTLVDTLPGGLTALSASGTGWTISIDGQTVTATRSDILAPGSSFPLLTIGVSIAKTAATNLINNISVSGGGISVTAVNSSDATTIIHPYSTFAQDVLDDGALALWTLSDSSTASGATAASFINPNLYNGTYQAGNQSGNGITSGPAAYPALGTAAYFHNSTSNTSLSGADVVITPNVGLPSGNADRTLIFWAKDDFTSTDSYYHVATEYGTPGTVHNSFGSYVFANGDSTAPAGGMGVSQWGGGTGTTTPFDDGQWHFFAVTVSGGGADPTYSVYADGVLQNAGALATNTALGIANTIGASVAVDPSGNHIVGWSGGIGDVGIFPIALSGSQIAQMYADAPNNPGLTVSTYQFGDFHQGDSADSYSLTVSNGGSVNTSGTITLTDTLPTGLTLASATGDGWTASISGQTVTATRTDTLAQGASLPALNIAFNVASDAPMSVASFGSIADVGGSAAANNFSITTTISAIPASFARDVIADGAIAFWPLNDSIMSAGAKAVSLVNPVAYDGTYQAGNQPGNGVTSGPAAYPALGTAAYFHNTGDNATLGSSDAVVTPAAGLPSGTDDRTLVFWAKDDFKSTDGSYHVATEYGTPGKKSVPPTTYYESFGTYVFAEDDGNVTAGVMGASQWGDATGTNGRADDGSWHFYAVTVSGGGGAPTYTVYLDGAPQNSKAMSTYTVLGMYNTIGAALSQNDSFNNIVGWKGGLGDVAIFPAALSSEQIGRMYADAPYGATLAVQSSPTGSFSRGDSGATYDLTVSNSGNASTTGTITVTDSLPSGLTPTAASGTGWTTIISGQTVTATRSDSLSGGNSFPTLTISLDVAENVPISSADSGVVSSSDPTIKAIVFSKAFTVLTTSGTLAQDILADGALAFWPLNDASTASGATAVSLANPNSYNGVYQNQVTSGPAAFPALGTAAYFHNTTANSSLVRSDAVITPSEGLPAGNADRTIVFWALDADTATDNAYHAATEYGTPGTVTAGMGTFVFSQSDSNSPVGGMAVSPWGGGVGTRTSMTDGRWHFFAVTISGGGATPTYQVYADGALQGSKTIATNTILGLANEIGAAPEVNGTNFVGWNGGLGDVAIFGKALSSAQIAQMYADSANAATNPEILVNSAGSGPTDPEMQSIALPSATGGTWTISFAGQTTVPLAWNVSANDVQAALQAINTIGHGNILVKGSGTQSSPFVVSFIGALAGIDVPPLTLDGTQLIGTSDSPVVSTVQNGGAGVLSVQQVILPAASAGTWTLSLGGAATAPLAWNASASQVRDALDALDDVGAGNSVVTGSGTSSDPFVVTFVGPLANRSLPQLTANGDDLLGALQSSTTELQRGASYTDTTQVITFPTDYDSDFNEGLGAEYFLSKRSFQKFDPIVGDWFAEGVQPIALVSTSPNPVPPITTELMQAALHKLGYDDVLITQIGYASFSVTFTGVQAGQDVPQLYATHSLAKSGGDFIYYMADWPSNGVTTQHGSIAPVNEIQRVTLPEATGGTFTLALDGQTSAPLAFNATPADIQTALEALSNVGAGNVTVQPVAQGYAVTFTGALGGQPVDFLQLDTTQLEGGSITTFIVPSSETVRSQIDRVDLVGVSSGWFSLSLLGEVTTPISYGASAATVQAAIEALPIQPDVTVTTDPNSPSGYIVTFGGTWSGINVQMGGYYVGTSAAATYSVMDGSELTGALTANETDVSDPMTHQLVSSVTHGTLTLSDDGHFTYVPTAGFTGTDTFTYRLTDGPLQGTVATITIDVTPTPPTLSIQGDNTANQGVPYTLDLNATEADGDTIIGWTIHWGDGEVDTISPDGSSSLAAVSATHTYVALSTTTSTNYAVYATATDQHGSYTTNTKNVAVYPPNQPPSFIVGPNEVAPSGEAAQTFVGWATAISAGPSFEANQSLTFHVSAADPALFSVQPAIDPVTGDLTFTPAPAAIGATNFNVTLQDNGGTADGGIDTSALQTFSISIAGQPLAVPDSYSVQQGHVLAVSADQGLLANDQPVGNTIEADVTTNPEHGFLSLNADGSFSYTPYANYAGTDTFTYKDRGNFVDSAPVEVTITVLPNSLSPQFVSVGIQSINQGSELDLQLRATDFNTPARPLSFSFGSQAPDGALLSAEGQFSWLANAAPGIYPVSIVVTQTTSPGLTDNDIFYIQVVAPNHVPTLAPIASQTVGQTGTLTVPLIAADPDGAAQTLTYSVAGLDGATIDSNHNLIWTPPAYDGPGDYSAKVTVTDNGAPSLSVNQTFNVTVLAVHQTAAALPLDFTVVRGTTLDVGADIGLLSESTLLPDESTLSASIVSQPIQGQLQANADGSFVYQAPNVLGTDQFTYAVSDGIGTSAPATVTFHIVDVAPVAQASSYQVVHDRTLSVTAQNGVLVGDSTHSQDPLIAQLVSNPAHGTLTLNPDGSFTYIPSQGYVGTDNFTYDAADSLYLVNGQPEASSPATVTIAVQDQAPTAVADQYTANISATLIIPAATGVLSNDFDADGDTLTASLVTGPSNGGVILHSDGSFQYQPNSGFVGTDSFTYVANDGAIGGQSQPTAVRILVTDSSPQASEESYTTLHGQVLTTTAADGVLANDWNPVTTTMTAVLVQNVPAQNGSLQLNSDGSFVFTPAPSFVGETTFSYKANNGVDSNIVTDTIDVVDSPPTATAGFYSTAADTALVVDATQGLLANAFEAHQGVLSASVVSSPSNGTLSEVSATTGAFTYTPNTGFVGQDSFTYLVSDGAESSTPVTVTIDVTDVAPVAAPKVYQVQHDQPLVVTADQGLLASATVAPGATVTIAITQQPSNGTLQTVNADGSFTFVPATGFTGITQFSYRLSDGALSSGVETVTIEVVDTPPVAQPDSYRVNHDRTLTVAAAIGVLANDSDLDHDPLTAQLITGVSHGSLTINSNGSFSYTPAQHYVGSDTFTYDVSDGALQRSPTTVTIDVIDTAPSVASPVYHVGTDTVLSVSAGSGLLAHSLDEEGDALQLVDVVNPQHGTLQLQTDGSFVYTPDQGFAGADTFSYAVSDGILQSAPATATIVVTDVTLFASDAQYTASYGLPLTVADSSGLLANDWNGTGNSPQIEVTAQPTKGTLSVDASGGFTYTPASAFVGTDTFQYDLVVGGSTSDTATVTISSVDAAPKTVPDTYHIHWVPSAGDPSHDELIVPSSQGVLANDTDNSVNSLTAELTGNPPNAGTLNLQADGSFTYQPAQLGTFTFSYVASDGVAQSTPTNVSIIVSDTAPGARDAYFQTKHDTTLNISPTAGLLSSSWDNNGDPLVVSNISYSGGGTLTWSANGSFQYTPAAHAIGTDGFTYTVSDGLLTAQAHVILDVYDTAPAVQSASYRVLHDHSLVVTDPSKGLLATAWDAESDAMSFQIASPPAHGTLSPHSDGTFTFQPAAGYTGSDSFSYTVSDGTLTSLPVTDSIDIYDSAPAAAPKAYHVSAPQALTVGAAQGLLSGAQDANGDAISLVSTSLAAAHGTLSVKADGSFSYTPTAGFVGLDSFTYQLTDGALTSGPIPVTIDVRDYAPRALPDAYTTPSIFSVNNTNSGLYVSAANGVLANDWDPDNATQVGPVTGGNGSGTTPSVPAMTAVLVSGPSHGTLMLNADGSFAYQPNVNYQGSDSFTYRATDGTLSSSPVTVSIQVVDHAPIALNDYYNTKQGVPLPGPLNVLSNDIDDDGNNITALLVGTGPANAASFTFNADGTFSFAPSPAFSGTTTFTYQATDGILKSAPATVTFDVAAGQLVPIADVFNTQQGAPVTGNVLTNDIVPSQGTKAVSDQGNGLSFPTGHGQVTNWTGDGSFIYTPNTTFAGTDTFTYHLVNGGEVSPVSATVTINVSGPDSVANDDQYIGLAGTPLVISKSKGVIANDYNASNTPSQAYLVTQPQNGTVILSSDGSFTYTPDSASVGGDSFTYSLSPAAGASTATVTLSLVQFATRDQSFSVRHGSTLSAQLAGGYGPGPTPGSTFGTDSLGEVTQAKIAENPTHGTLQLFSDGSFLYTPATGSAVSGGDYVGTDQFTYAVTNGVETSAPVTVTVQVTGSTVTVTAPNVTQAATVNQPARNVLPGGDIYSTLTFSAGSQPSHGSLVVNPDGSYVYVPNVNWVGTDSFEYAVGDGASEASGTVQMVVSANALRSGGGNYTYVPGQALTVAAIHGLLSQQFGFYGSSVPLNETATLAHNAANGSVSVNPDGSFTYQPNSGFTGSDSFTYSVSDGLGPAVVGNVVLSPALLAPTGTAQLPVEASGEGHEVLGGAGHPLADEFGTGPNSVVVSVDGGVVDVNVVGSQVTCTWISGSNIGISATSTSYGFGGAPDIKWIGADVANLSIVGGSVSDVSINGNLQVIAERNIGNLVAQSVAVVLYTGTLGSVTATSGDAFVGNSIGEGGYRDFGPLSVGAVSAPNGNVNIVADYLTGPVTAGKDVGLSINSGGIAQSVTAGGLLDNLYVGGTVAGTVTVAGTAPDATEYIGEDLSGTLNLGTGKSNLLLYGDLTGTLKALDISATVGGGTWYGIAFANRSDGHGLISGTVSATDAIDNLTAQGSISPSARLSATDSVSNVSTAGDFGGTVTGGIVGTLNAGRDFSATVTSQMPTGATPGGGTVVTAYRHITGAHVTSDNSVSLTGTLGNVDATVTTTDGAAASSISAAGDISGSYDITGPVQSVHAGGNITARVTSGATIASVQAGKDIGGAGIQATGDITAITAGSIDSDISSVRGSIGSVTGHDNISGNISAGNNVSTIYSGGNISGNLAVNGTLDSLFAYGNISGGIRAGSVRSTGSTSFIEAGGNVTGSVRVYGDIAGRIIVGQNLTGNIIADGSIGSVLVGQVFTLAGQQLGPAAGTASDSTISAGTNIGDIQVNQWRGVGGTLSNATITAGGNISSLNTDQDLNAAIKATGTIGTVQSNYGAISGSIASMTASINSVASLLDDSATVTAGSSIGAVVSKHGSLGGAVTASGADSNEVGIAKVVAGKNITGAINAQGSITTVLAGADGSGGNISGNIVSGGSIGTVTAKDLGNLTVPPQVAVTQTNVSTTSQSAPPPPPATPTPPRLPGAAGNITGTVTAGGGINSITAFGTVAAVTANGGDIGQILAGGNITGAVKATAGALDSVATWGGDNGTVTALGNIVLTAISQVSGAVLSRSGTILLDTFGALGGNVSGFGSVGISAGSVTGGTISANSPGSVLSIDTFGILSAAALISGGPMAVYALGINCGQISVGSFLTSSVANYLADGSVLYSDGSINAGTDHVTEGSIVAYARNGSISGTFTSDDGGVDLIAGGDVNARATARQDIGIVSRGDVSGAGLKSSDGSVAVQAKGDISVSSYSAANSVQISAAGAVTGADLIAGLNSVAVFAGKNFQADQVISAHGTVSIRALGDVSGQLISGKSSVEIDSAGAVSGSSVTSGAGGVTVSADKDISAPIQAMTTATVSSYGNLNAAISSATGAVTAFAGLNIASSATVNAYGNAAVVAWGAMNGSVSAGVGNPSGGGVIADVTSLGSETGTVQSTGRVQVLAFGAVSGSLTANQGNVSVDAYGQVSSTIVATKGSIDVVGWDQVNSTLTTGDSGQNVGGGINVNSQLAANITATAGQAVSVGSGTTLTGTVTSRQAGINVSALGTVGTAPSDPPAISNLSLTATQGSVAVFSGGNISSLTVQAGPTSLPTGGASTPTASATVVALGDVGGTINALNDSSVQSTGNVTLNATVLAGAFSIAADGSLYGNFKSSGDLNAGSLADASGQYTSTAGNASVTGLTSVDATIQGQLSASEFSGGSARGSVSSDGGTASVVALSSDSATIKALVTASGAALGGDITGTITSTQGEADALASGSVNANVSGKTAVQVTAQQDVGSSTTILASAGPVTIVAGHNVAGSVSGQGVTITAGNNLSGAITAPTGDINATAYGSASGALTATTGNVSLFSAGPISGAVTAQQSATVSTLGNLTSNVTATTGDVNVSAAGDITGNASAGDDVTAWAQNNVAGQTAAGDNADVTAWNDVSGAITAGGNTSAWAYHDVTGNVIGGGNANVFAAGGLLAPVTATTGSATVSTFGPIQSTITAGQAATVQSFSTLDGVVLAGTGASVFALGTINAGITATTGGASVATFGDLVGSISAGQDIIVSSVGNASANLSAGGNIGLNSQGSVTPGLVTAGGNVSVLALGTLAVPAVTAEGNVALGSLGRAQVTVIHAGGDANAFSNSDLTANLNATGSASAMAMGNLSATLSAGQYATAWALGDVHDSFLSAGQQASITALGQATNDTLSGTQGAFVLGRGNVSGITAVSTAGDASVASLSTATDLNITAHGNATAAAFGNLNAANLVATTGEVDTYSVGSTSASVQSGGNANLTSFGGLALTGPGNAPAQIGGNLTLNVVGDGIVSASVGNNVTAIDYGNLQGTITAGGSINQLWTTGNLTGSYTAGGWIGTVTSYGSIDAALTASGGSIYQVAAWNSLGGSLTASGDIGALYAGGTITAAVSAPSVGGMFAHDRSQFIDHPVAPTPQTGETLTAATQAVAAAQLFQNILASGAVSQLAAANATRAGLLQSLDYQMGQLASAQSAVAAAVNGQRSQTTAALGQLQDSLQQLLASATNDATWTAKATTDAVHKSDQVAKQQLADLQRQANDGKADATNQLNLFTLARSAQLGQAADMVTQLTKILDSIDPAIDEAITLTESRIGSLMWGALLRPVHTFLDRASLVTAFVGPGGQAVSSICDLVNGALFFSEGQTTQAFIRVVSALPWSKLFKSAANSTEAGAKLFGGAAKNADNALSLGTRGGAAQDLLRAEICAAGKSGCFVTGTPVVVGEVFELAADDSKLPGDEAEVSWEYAIMTAILVVAVWRLWEKAEQRRLALAEAREELFATVDPEDLWRDPYLALRSAEHEIDRELDPSALETCLVQSETWHEEF